MSLQDKSEKNKPGTAQVGAISKTQLFLVSGKLHSAEKWKRGSLGVFKHPCFLQIRKKLNGDHLETLKEFGKKSLTKPKNLHKKFLVIGGTQTHVLLLGKPQKSRHLYAKCQ